MSFLFLTLSRHRYDACMSPVTLPRHYGLTVTLYHPAYLAS